MKKEKEKWKLLRANIQFFSSNFNLNSLRPEAVSIWQAERWFLKRTLNLLG